METAINADTKNGVTKIRKIWNDFLIVWTNGNTGKEETLVTTEVLTLENRVNLVIGMLSDEIETIKSESKSEEETRTLHICESTLSILNGTYPVTIV